MNRACGRTPSGGPPDDEPLAVRAPNYLGTGHLVGTTLDQANLNTSVFAESGGTHTYADLDRFNRPTRWNWERVGGASGGFSNTVIAYDENSNPVSTTDAARARNSTSKHPFDVVYGVDDLNRVIAADEGNITAGAIESGTRTRRELWNSLSLTGNWGNRQLDANGDGDFGDEADRDEPSAYNTFNTANEWTARRVAKAGGSDRDEHAYTYDAAGNLTDLALTVYRGANSALTHRRLVYDAFGRLVRAASVAASARWDFRRPLRSRLHDHHLVPGHHRARGARGALHPHQDVLSCAQPRAPGPSGCRPQHPHRPHGARAARGAARSQRPRA